MKPRAYLFRFYITWNTLPNHHVNNFRPTQLYLIKVFSGTMHLTEMEYLIKNSPLNNFSHLHLRAYKSCYCQKCINAHSTHCITRLESYEWKCSFWMILFSFAFPQSYSLQMLLWEFVILDMRKIWTVINVQHIIISISQAGKDVPSIVRCFYSHPFNQPQNKQ